MSQYFLGVDGGQSSTRACIGDATGRVLGAGFGGPCGHASAGEGRARFVTAMEACLRGACEQAGLNAETVCFASACLGLSGGPANKEPILREILRADRMLVTDDATIALAGATAGEPGIVVIAGTGSIAFGRNRGDRTARAGGWGYLFGDEGGAFWIARQAIRTALRQEEGWGAGSPLRTRLLDATVASSMNDLMHRCYTAEFPRSRIAKLAIVVNEAAEDGVSVAAEILQDAARELVTLVRAVREQLFAPDEPTLVAWWGGVFRSHVVLARFHQLLESEAGVSVKERVYEPAVGALFEAYRAAGLRLSTIQPIKLDRRTGFTSQPFP